MEEIKRKLGEKKVKEMEEEFGDVAAEASVPTPELKKKEEPKPMNAPTPAAPQVRPATASMLSPNQTPTSERDSTLGFNTAGGLNQSDYNTNSGKNNLTPTKSVVDNMKSTPEPTAASPVKPAPAPTRASAAAPATKPAADNRSWLQKALNMKPMGRNAPAPTPGGAPKTVAQQAASGTTAATMRNVSTGIGQNAADRARGTQNIVKPGEADAAAGKAAAPRPETGAGLSKVSNPNSPEVRDKVASVTKADAERSPIDVNKAINTAAKVDAPAPLSGLDKPAPAPAPAAKPAAEPTFGQAFAAARKAAGGAGGSFQYGGKTFQTNIKGEKYQAASKLKPVAMRESLESVIKSVLKD